MKLLKSLIIIAVSMSFITVLGSQAWAEPPQQLKELKIAGAHIFKPAPGDVWCKGQQYEIRWQGIDLAPDEFALMHLFRDESGGVYLDIGSFPEHSNAILFRVRDDIESSDHYIVKIMLFRRVGSNIPSVPMGTIESKPYLTIKTCPPPVIPQRAIKKEEMDLERKMYKK